MVPLCSGLFRGQRTAYGVNWHGVLNVAGMIPGVGPWADLANAGLYAWEGDWLGAGQSLWSALPGIGDAFQGTKVATGVSKFASHGDDVAGTAKRIGSGKPLSVNQLARQVEARKNGVPRTVKRIDRADIRNHTTQPHVHFTDGTSVYFDGTPRHGRHTLTSEEKRWARKNGLFPGLL